MSAEHYLCFDVGGTSVKFGLLSADGEVLETRSDPTPESGEALLGLLEGRSGDFPCAKPLGIGVATTGLIDPWRGEVLPGSNPIPGYGGVHLRAELARRTGLPVEIENDVNCALLGESWLGAARGYRNAVCITVGTGIGGALMVGGELYRGSRFDAMEVGYIPFPPASRAERCPGWEEIASTRATLLEYAKSTGERLDGRQLMARVRAGEPAAVRVLDDLCFYLARGIATLYCVLTPDVFVFGGGIAGSMDLLRHRLDMYLERALEGRFREGVDFKAAELGDHAPLAGALRHFLNMREHRRKEKE